MLLLVPCALAVPFGGLALQGTTPLLEEYAEPGLSGGAYAGATFPRMGFEVRSTWGSGAGTFEYNVQTARVDGLHLFRPDDWFDPFLLLGVGYRATSFPSTVERNKARRLGILDNPALVPLAEVGGGVIVRVVGPVHVRLDTRVWVGGGIVNHQDRAFLGLDASLGLEIRLVKRRDRDGDGLLDRDDVCPDEPEDIDRLLDHDGCPDVDIDRDGIADELDKCATRPETVNQFQDTDGCPDIVPVAALAPAQVEPPAPIPSSAPVPPPATLIDTTRSLGRIAFVHASVEMLPESEPALREAIRAFREHRDVAMEIRVHTDELGVKADDLALSKARAEVIKAWLAAHGLDAARLTAVGVDEAEPADTEPGDTEEGDEPRLRVTFLVRANQ